METYSDLASPYINLYSLFPISFHIFVNLFKTQARQQEELEEDTYGGFGDPRPGVRGRERERLSRNLSISHESVFQMEPLPNQVRMSSEWSYATPSAGSTGHRVVLAN